MTKATRGCVSSDDKKRVCSQRVNSVNTHSGVSEQNELNVLNVVSERIEWPLQNAIVRPE